MGHNSRIAGKILRFGLGAVFLWFGISQLINPQYWVNYMPLWIINLGPSLAPKIFVYINALFEILFGFALILKQYTKVVSLILALHMVGIVLTLGYNELGVGNFGMIIGLVALIFLSDNSSVFNKE